MALLWLTKEKHIAEGAVARATNGDAQRPLKQIGIFVPHHVAQRIIAQIALPVVQLSVTHEDVVVVIGFKERRTMR